VKAPDIAKWKEYSANEKKFFNDVVAWKRYWHPLVKKVCEQKLTKTKQKFLVKKILTSVFGTLVLGTLFLRGDCARDTYRTLTGHLRDTRVSAGCPRFAERSGHLPDTWPILDQNLTKCLWDTSVPKVVT
jgi:hypothetical protein